MCRTAGADLLSLPNLKQTAGGKLGGLTLISLKMFPVQVVVYSVCPTVFFLTGFFYGQGAHPAGIPPTSNQLCRETMVSLATASGKGLPAAKFNEIICLSLFKLDGKSIK